MKAIPDPSGLGVDLSVEPDLGEVQKFVVGRDCLIADLAHRLQTPRGTLFYDASYGYDVRRLLLLRLDSAALFAAESEIRAELLKDARVASARVQLTAPQVPGGKVSIVADVATAQGPFALVLAVSADLVEVL